MSRSVLAYRAKSGRLLRIAIIRPNRHRRELTVRAMRRAGWPWWRIAAVLKVRRERVEGLAYLAAVWDQPTHKEICRQARRVGRFA